VSTNGNNPCDCLWVSIKIKLLPRKAALVVELRAITVEMFGEITKDMLVSDHKHRGPRF
jgi:hypothetical protein